MKRILVSSILLVPALMSGQVTGAAKGSATAAAATSKPLPAQASAQAQAMTALHVPDRFSASGKAQLEATYNDARRSNLPTAPIAKRVAEGEAKGASEASIVAAAARVKGDMEASQRAMIAAGRTRPSGEETERGAMLMARGVTSAQIETVARHAPSDRSLVVAFDVLGRLSDQGMPVTQALARVQAKLDSRASDAVLISMAGSQHAGAAGQAGASAGAGAGVGVNAGVGVSAGAATRGTTTAATGVGAGVAGAVTGVVKKP
ncbi:MAG: hypothetical protein HYV19_03510 [Gemmatimonadetes bacterium]|nr:hypothetical protein [Gemmatimonadota bacterium]